MLFSLRNIFPTAEETQVVNESCSGCYFCRGGWEGNGANEVFWKKKTEQNIYCRLYLILNCAVVN